MSLYGTLQLQSQLWAEGAEEWEPEEEAVPPPTTDYAPSHTVRQRAAALRRARSPSPPRGPRGGGEQLAARHEGLQLAAEADGESIGESIGLGRILALYYRSFTLHQIH
jgi:hypothetical protein